LSAVHRLNPLKDRSARAAIAENIAVAAVYGWADCTPEMSDDEILRKLLALNLERSTLINARGSPLEVSAS
jgi:hypothetical protein